MFNNDKGIYFAYEFENFIGVAFSIGYHVEEKDFQISLQIGTLALAIGYEF